MKKTMCIAFGCGLGNQMFQYAFYYAMKEKYPNHIFLADEKIMLPQQHNGYELDSVFGIRLEECRLHHYIGYIRHIYFNSKLALPINFLLYLTRKAFPNKTFYKQGNYSQYYPEVFTKFRNTNAFLKGIWANESYFKPYREKLLEKFCFQQKLDNNNEKILERIHNSMSVSIHIRRGDYLKGNNNILDENYYCKAVRKMEEKLDNPTYFVFSDDIEAAKHLMECVTKKDVYFVEGNQGKDSWKDMYLMSCCKNNIIANSSFSFWGAYLNDCPDRIIISSRVPMSNSLLPYICEGWIQV